MKLCKKCKKELVKELRENPKWNMTYGIPAFKMVNEFIKLVEESEETNPYKKGKEALKRLRSRN